MPGFDGSGPLGRGPGTGRGAGYSRPLRMGYGYGRGFWGRGSGFGYGRGAGWGPCRWWAGSPFQGYGPGRPDNEDEKAFLQEQSDMLKEDLANIEQRISELDQQSG